ncbi:AbfB domain-containing protein [Agromyces subbeticus]|uniref:AbfB domain-containing protein n=1 Tax=Agromyces subbeticus TaxID=293890 RepID=UPI0003B4D0E0|nr:AbfB domain-containing protein [Agromyces subbeticus]
MTALTRRNVLGGALFAASVAAAGAAASPAQAVAGRAVAPRMAITSLGGSTYAHPGLLHTASDLGDLATRIAAHSQPWYSGYERLAANGRSNPGWNPRPLATVIRGGTGQNYMQMAYDIHAAYQNALRWRATGIEEHGAAAVRILNAWSSSLVAVGGNADRFLAAGIYGYQFANAAELVRERSDFELTAFRDMLLNVFHPMNEQFLTFHNNAVITNYWANWDLCNMASILAIGIFADRDDLVDRAVDYFHNGAGNGSLPHAVPFVYADEGLAQWQESGRDQGHTMMGMGLMGAICEMAWNQGIDLWGADDNRFLKAAEYVAKYNLGNDVPFTPYSWQTGPNTTAGHVGWQTQTVVGAGSRGQLRPVWEAILGHYAGRRGLAAPWTAQMVQLVRAEGGGGDYGQESGGYDQLGFGTLTAAAVTVGERVSRLQAFTHPGHYVAASAGSAALAADPVLGVSRFRVVSGLAGTADGRVSFESVEQPGTYLRHSSFRIVAHQSDGSSLFAADATFVPVTGLGHSMLSSFRSHNFADRYLRHRNFQLWIDPIANDQDRADATFRLVD